jgi:hypothetical protein
MRRALISLCVTWLGLTATASASDGFVVWTLDGEPGEKEVAKAERLAGATTHLAHVDLAFPPMPATPEDAARIEALREAIASGKARWDEFDVELSIARELESALVPIDLIRDKRDLQDLVDARLFQGAAVQKAFSPEMFATSDDALPFRRSFPGLVGNAPWLGAMALDPEREFTRADVADGSAFPDLQALRPAFDLLPSGTVDITALPAGATLVIDGREVAGADGTVKLRPGQHYTHVVRNGRVSGRQRLEIGPGESVPVPMLVDATELEQARAQVLLGLTTGLPDDVKASIEHLSKHHAGPIFVAAIDDKGRTTILPYARGAQLFKQKPVTFVLAGEVGGGVIVSSLFNEADGTNVTAPAVLGSLGFELGIYNFALLGGADIGLTPANTVTRGKIDGSGDVTTSILPRGWGGAGLYVLRPSGNTPTLLLAGTYGFNYPAHLAAGGRVALGVPIDDRGTWFRLAIGGDAAARSMWEGELRDIPMYTLYLRIGLAARL